MYAYERETYCRAGTSQHKSAESAETKAEKKACPERLGLNVFPRSHIIS